jgi:TonB family protein
MCRVDHARPALALCRGIRHNKSLHTRHAMRNTTQLLLVGLFMVCGCEKPQVQSPTKNQSKTSPQTTSTTEPTRIYAERPGVDSIEVIKSSGAIGSQPVATFCDPQDTSEDPCGLLAVPLKAGMTPPKKIAEKCEPPVYPKAARQESLAGNVTFKITLNKEGKVTEVMFIKGAPEFVEASITYLKNCEFTPAKLDDKPIAVTKLETIKFTLN